MSCVVICHSRVAAVAHSLAMDLMAEKITTTFATEAILDSDDPSMELQSELTDRLCHCSVIICALGRDFEECRYCRQMVFYASNLEKVIVPVRVEPGYVVGQRLGSEINGLLVRDISTEAGYQKELPEILTTVKVLLSEAVASSGEAMSGGAKEAASLGSSEEEEFASDPEDSAAEEEDSASEAD